MPCPTASRARRRVLAGVLIAAVGACATVAAFAEPAGTRPSPRAAPAEVRASSAEAERRTAPPGTNGDVPAAERQGFVAGLARAALCCLAAAAVTAGSLPSRAERVDLEALDATSKAKMEADIAASIAGEMKAQGFDAAQPAQQDAQQKMSPSRKKEAKILTADEQRRRHEAGIAVVGQEQWFLQGKEIFENKCAGCHVRGNTAGAPRKSLYWPALLKQGYAVINADGYYEPKIEVFREVVAYGKGTMPGWAEDCKEVNEDNGGLLRCGVTNALTNREIQNTVDFVISRTNEEWSGRGGG